MKKLNFTCPKCNSIDARQWSRENMHFHDDEVYEILKEEFGENADCENYYTAKCICDDCDHYFKAIVIIDIQAIEIRY